MKPINPKAARAVELFAEGLDTTTIAERLGVSRPRVAEWLRKSGVNLLAVKRALDLPYVRN